MIRPVLTYPDRRLKEKAANVEDTNSQEIQELIQDLIDTMYAENGVGLAATQIGVPHRVFVLDARVAGFPESVPPLVFINPEITEESKETQEFEEGCLSFPGIFVKVTRPLKATCNFISQQGVSQSITLQGLFCIAAMHELDHLNGVTFIDRVSPVKRESIKRQLRK